MNTVINDFMQSRKFHNLTLVKSKELWQEIWQEL